jgi:hypothetical protein
MSNPGHPPPHISQIQNIPPIYNGRKRRAAPSAHLRELERALDMTRFCDQLKRLIDQPIKFLLMNLFNLI